MLVLPSASLAAHFFLLSESTFFRAACRCRTQRDGARPDETEHDESHGHCTCFSQPQRCRLMSLASESSTHVFVNIVGGDAPRFLRPAQSLYLATTHQRVSFIFHISNRYFLYILTTWCDRRTFRYHYGIICINRSFFFFFFLNNIIRVRYKILFRFRFRFRFIRS